MVDEPDDDAAAGSGRESYRERKARMRAIHALANTLVGLESAQLGTVPLGEELDEAVRACQRFTKNARARQLRRIGGLLRQAELEPIERALREIESGRGERSRREQGYEHWRTRLLAGGDAAMTAFVAAHPGADVQQLRQLVRTAVREPERPRGKGAARELLRAIRALGEAGSGAAPADHGDAVDAADGDD